MYSYYKNERLKKRLVHTADCGQVSINISKPGITKGQHWHNSKWELFIVVAGHGLIQERNIHTGEMVEFEVSGDKIEAVHMIPGWTHNIINLSETENLVTVMTCNEIFNPERPDVTGSPMAEVLHQNLPEIEKSDILEKLGLEPQKYILLSAHREENIDTEKNFLSLFTAINLKPVVSSHRK